MWIIVRKRYEYRAFDAANVLVSEANEMLLRGWLVIQFMNEKPVKLVASSLKEMLGYMYNGEED